MADHFLTKSPLDRAACLAHGTGLALESYPALHTALIAGAGPDAARLFAEPLISRGNDQAAPTVAWYTDVEGEGTPLSRLDETEQAQLNEVLTRELRSMRDLIDDPDDGPLISAALHVLGPDDIWSVGGRPVIINWGMVPAEIGRDRPSRSGHYAATLGRFLPLGSAPPLTDAERRMRRDEIAASPRGTAAAAVAGGAAAGALAANAAAADDGPKPQDTAPPPPEDPPSAPDHPAERRRVPLLAWLPLVLLLLLATGTLVWLLLPQTRLFPEQRAAAISDAEALALAEGVNRSLEERLASLRTALAGAVCEPTGTLLMPDGRTIEGLLPPDPDNPGDGPGRVAEASPTPILPPDPARVQPQGDTASLLEVIDARTALVLVTAPQVGNGTGFFVGPDLLVTNYHVVEGAEPGSIYVTSKALGSARPAEVLKLDGPFETTGVDFALLRVPGVSQSAFEIHTSDQSLRLQSVIAAGYPGDLMSTDREFRALIDGDASAVPELAVTDGAVTTEQTFSERTQLVVHSAPISRGNSGGPLVDMCGRVVGVNTFVREGDLRNLNFAFSMRDLAVFLRDTPAVPTIVSQSCQPQIARPAPPAPAPAAGDASVTPITPLPVE